MADKPILFSGAMIQALLDGRKTQTRRVLKPQPVERPGMNCRNLTWVDRHGQMRGMDSPEGPCPWIFTPYAPGDLLWCRESFAKCTGCNAPENGGVIYKADGVPSAHGWKPSIHMPQRLSRLTLEVTDVRVQRVQEISEEDAKAEGIYFMQPTAEDLDWYRDWAPEHGIDPEKEPMEGVWMVPGVRGLGGIEAERKRDAWAPTAAFGYRLLWNSLNEKRGFGWDVNPWVAVPTFTVHRCNIDNLKGASQ